jgi:hypothetical protein
VIGADNFPKEVSSGVQGRRGGTEKEDGERKGREGGGGVSGEPGGGGVQGRSMGR